MLRKCPKCYKTFESNSIRKIYCDECLKELHRESVSKDGKRIYDNDEDYRKKKKHRNRRKKHERFVRDNYYGLILGTTEFGSKPNKDFKREAEIVNKQKNVVLKGKTYKSSKFMDLQDGKKPKKSGIRRKNFKSAELPKNLNNVKNIDYYKNRIIKELNLDVTDDDIIGVYKIELPLFNRYILFTKYKGRVVENIIDIPSRLDNECED